MWSCTPLSYTAEVDEDKRDGGHSSHDTLPSPVTLYGSLFLVWLFLTVSLSLGTSF